MATDPGRHRQHDVPCTAPVEPGAAGAAMAKRRPQRRQQQDPGPSCGSWGAALGQQGSRNFRESLAAKRRGSGTAHGTCAAATGAVAAMTLSVPAHFSYGATLR